MGGIAKVTYFQVCFYDSLNFFSFQLHEEQEEHKKTKEDLINNNADFKQLNRGI